MISVIDTSALVRLCTARDAEWPQDLDEHLDQTMSCVPDIVDVEFQHAVRGLVLGGKISAERGEHARSVFSAMPLTRLASRILADRIWSLRHNLGAYDACFIALAEALDAPLVTCDAKHDGVPGHAARVLVFPAGGSVNS